MKITTPLLVALASMQIASAASYTNYSSVSVAGFNFSNYSVQNFNSDLGTLTGVQVSLSIQTLTGSVDVFNGTVSTVFVNQFDSYLTLRDASGTSNGIGPVLGYDNALGKDTISPVATGPDWAVTPIPATPGSQTFNINSGQNFGIASQSIAPTYFAAYQSSGASGYETFQIKSVQSITTTGGIYTVDSTNAGTNAQVAVTYTYVPEPSSALLGGLGLLGLIRRRR